MYWPLNILSLLAAAFINHSISEQYRLPTTIIPTHYDITIHPNFNTLTFKGWIYITLAIKPRHFNDTTMNNPFLIQFNQGRSINISQIQLDINSTLSSFQYVSRSQSYNIKTQINSIDFINLTNYNVSTFINNTNNNIKLYMIYSGVLNTDRYDGFYLSQYEYNNIIIKNAVTQFAPIDARGTFPCWDEPDFKATFNISYIAPINALTISNMPIINEEIFTNISNEYECLYTSHNGNTSTLCKHVSFQQTPIMSTYLVFFALCDYNYFSYTSHTNYTQNVLQTVYFPYSSNAQYAQYGFNESLQILPYFGQLFSHNFPLPKLDSICVTDYKFGAMENYGAITYRNTRFLIDASVASVNSLNSVSRIIGHEIAHQWFGNLVTHRWWNHIWLKEGFATYFEYIANQYTQNELNPWYHFYVTNMNGIMLSSDASIFIRPIVRNVLTPQQIREVYDGIVYDKAGSILYHLRNYLRLLQGDISDGDEVFYDSLRNYLTKWQGDNAVSEDLLLEFDAYFGDELISQFMHPWLYNAGFPLLSVTMKEIEDNKIEITLKQQRFVKEGPLFFDEEKNKEFNPYYDEEKAHLFAAEIWQIPIQIQVYNGMLTEFEHGLFANKLMSGKNITFEIERYFDSDNEKTEYYLFNPEMRHYFRVIYDNYSFQMISNNFHLFSDLNQFNIISDLYQEMLSGYFSPITYLQFVSNVCLQHKYNVSMDEPLFLMHEIVINSLISIDSMLCGLDDINDEIRANFRKYAIDLLSPLLNDVNGWNYNYSLSDSEEISRLRSDLISAMIIFGDSDTIHNGYQIILDVINNGTYIDLDSFDDSNLIEPLFAAALSTLDPYIYEAIMHTFISNDSLQNVILNSFGAVYRDYNLTQNSITFLLSNRNLSVQQILRGLSSFKQCYGRQLVWDNLMRNGGLKWKELYGFAENTMISFADSFSSINGYNKVFSFYFNNSDLGNNSALKLNETLENIYMNVQWIKINYNELNNYLKARHNGDNAWSTTPIVLVTGIAVLIITIACIIYCRVRHNKIKLQPRFSSPIYDQMLQRDKTSELAHYRSTDNE